MRVTILGCGASTGVPVIGNDWGVCDPNNSRNRRLRSSILVEQGRDVVLVDTGPDLRAQLLSTNVREISAVLYTHLHSDHVAGMDDLRGLYYHMRQAIPIYADAETLKYLKLRFSYLFKHSKDGLYHPLLEPNIIEPGQSLQIGDLPAKAFAQDHYGITSLGYRFGKLAYSTDLVDLDEQGFEALKGVEIWIVECLREEPHPSHVHLDKVLQWIERVGPRKAYLTHMNQTVDYDSLNQKLPDHIEPAYDGLVIEVDE